MLSQHKSALQAIKSLRKIAEQDIDEFKQSLLEILNSGFEQTRRERQIAEFVVEQIREHLQDIEKENNRDIVQPKHQPYIDKMVVVGRAVVLISNAKIAAVGSAGVKVNASVFDDMHDYRADFEIESKEDKAEKAKHVIQRIEDVKRINSGKGRSRIIISNE